MLMLPHAYDLPAGVLKAFVGVTVTSHVATELLAPPVAVALRQRPVFRTSMPETSIDENRNPSAREYEIRAATPEFRERRNVDPVPQPPLMEFAPKGELWIRVPTSLRFHTPFRLG